MKHFLLRCHWNDDWDPSDPQIEVDLVTMVVTPIEKIVDSIRNWWLQLISIRSWILLIHKIQIDSRSTSCFLVMCMMIHDDRSVKHFLRYLRMLGLRSWILLIRWIAVDFSCHWALMKRCECSFWASCWSNELSLRKDSGLICMMGTASGHQ